MASALVSEWREVGGLGRLATAGVLLSGIVAVGLGVGIEASVHRHLLDARAELLQRVVDDLTAEGFVPVRPEQGAPAGTVLAAVEDRLPGGETVRVAIRDATGATVYGEPGDAPWPGSRRGGELPHVEQHADGLLHLVLPVPGARGDELGSLEVFQRAASFDAVLTGVRRNVWLSISTGLATLGIAVGGLGVAHARVLGQRRRHAERLLRELLDTEDRERRRIVGALHDDVGQPLYRVLYGLEGCRARLDGRSDIDSELRGLVELVRQVDGTLRAELRSLHRCSLEALDLASALEAAARECRDESGLPVTVSVSIGREPSPVIRSVLLRAVQEGLVNVRKHARASTVSIRAEGDDRWVTIEVVDDGEGPSGRRGLGLTTATERLAGVGGRLTFGRRPTGETVLRVSAPVDGEVTP